MKKIYALTLTIGFFVSFRGNSQVTWNANGNPATPPAIGITAANNFLGTTVLNNTPIRLGTQGRQRIYIDNTLNGISGSVGISTMFSTTIRPFSNLHIQQDNNNFAFGGGFRPWMQPSAQGSYSGGTGIMISNGDNIFLGLRNKGGIFDANDAILNWGDNGGIANQGADFFRFVFTNYNLGVEPGGNVDGLEILRLAPNSNVGIGDFQINGQFNPQSKLHMHEDLNLHNGGGQGKSIWFQMTNQDFAAAPTGNNGLKIGLLYQNILQRTGNAFIYNQENRHLIFGTNHFAPDGAGSVNNTLERMRITSIGAPTTTPTGYGLYNPGNITNTDLTRIAISHDPTNPVTRPLSLLHLGYNAQGTGTPTDLSGWRSWMDVGTFTNQSSGTLGGISMYSGLKVNPFPNVSADAVLSWGYDASNSTFPTLIPTRMRFLFTTNASTVTTSGGTSGIEAAHFWSDGNNTRMGVGNMQTANVDPQNTLEIRSSANSPYNATGNASGLRFTNLTSSDAVVPNGTNAVNSTKVLTVDGNGDVVLTNAAAAFGNICGTMPQNPLFNNWEIPLNNHNYIFSSPDSALTNMVGIGTSCLPTAKLHVRNTRSTVAQGYSITGLFENNSTGIGPGGNALNMGVWAKSLSPVPGGGSAALSINIGVRAEAGNNLRNIGVTGSVFSSINSAQNIGGSFPVTLPSSVLGNNTGVLASANNNNGGSVNSGGRFSATYGSSSFGVFATASQGASNYAVYASAQPPTGIDTTTNTNYAGFFNGGVYAGSTIFASDELLKKDMVEIPANVLVKLTQLEPISFKFDQDIANDKGLSLPSNLQYGFKAQQVASLFPNLVSGVHKPEILDTAGNVEKAAYDFKGVNYVGFIALLTKGIQEQQKQIDSLTTAAYNKDSIQDAQIQQLMDMINACCQNQGGRNNMNNNSTSTIAQTNVELSDKDAIVLNQNVPNPFAEQTTITFNIPEKSGFAQIIFNDMKGQIIKVVDIKTKGRGQLNVFANDLSTGMYSYSLYVDGKLADTKKMVKTE